LCRKCWRLITVAPPGLLAHPKQAALTPEEWVARINETAEPWRDCRLATVGVLHEGYRRIKGRGIGTRLVHRFLWEQAHDLRLDRREVIDHTCHNADLTCPGGYTCLHRRCIVLDHMEVTSIAENWSRGRRGGTPRR
jgi:hypothetical protein